MAFLAAFAMTTFYAIFGLYALQKFAYGPQEVGVILMVVGLVSALAQGVLTGPLSQRWGEARLIQVTLVATAAGFVAIALSNSFATFLGAIGLFSLATALLNPAVSALTSRRAMLEQGITMGLSNAFTSLGRIAGPALSGFVFDIHFEYPNWLGAGVMLVGFFASLAALKVDQKDSLEIQPAQISHEIRSR